MPRKTFSKPIDFKALSDVDDAATGSAPRSPLSPSGSVKPGQLFDTGPSQRELELEQELEIARKTIARFRGVSVRDCEDNRKSADYVDGKSKSDECNVVPEVPFQSTSLPKVEIGFFDGNPVGYWKFMRQFEYYVESRASDPGQRLLYLMYYCKGKARSAIDACVMLPPADGYKRARNILQELFGLPHVVARSLLDELLSEARQVRNNAESLSNLALKMENCHITLTQMHCESDLNSIATLEGLVRYLPVILQHQWAELADKLNCDGYDLTFDHLVEFVSRRARIARSRFGQLTSSASGKTNQAQMPLMKNSHPGERRIWNIATTNRAASNPCSNCNGRHEVGQCPRFLAADVKTRWDIAKGKSLCFVCLHRSHSARDCKCESGCTVAGCNRRHHSLLHFAHSVEHNPVKVECSNAAISGHVCLGYFAVKIETPKGLVSAVALLDSGSDTTLLRTDFAAKYGLKGKPTNVVMHTLGQEKKLQCSRINFNLRSADGNEVVEVTDAYTIEKLPGLPEQSLCEIAKRFDHLKDIKFDEVEGDEVTVLIGCDVPEAHWVLEQRLGCRNQPFATKTALGWIMQGPANRRSKSVNLVGSHEGQTVDLDRQMRRLYDGEFADLYTEESGLSRNDEIALQIVDKTTLSKGHFEVPLPWKPSEIRLPDNRLLAERRLNFLRRRFERDPQLFQRYTEVLQHHFDCGHIEALSDTSPIQSRVWYLPHHPVFNPKKPEKCRIVFDCAAKHMNVSLNDALLQGPNLTINLVDVLLRFRLHEYAVAADIKEMFLQVGIPETDRDYLRLLWWRNNDMKLPIERYRMTVHPFGATSSPFCATYALRETAKRFGHMYEPVIAQYITSNFYVDDCLLSAPTLEEASSAMNQLKELLELGGFKLTKWVSNDHGVLASIPIEERAPGVRMITEDKQPVERMLGVNWHAFKDEFSLQFSMPQRTLTRRGLLSMVSSLYDPLGFVSPWILPGKTLLQETCKHKLGWDEHLPMELMTLYERWIQGLQVLGEVRVPRCIGVLSAQTASIELHIFCDASEVGHGAVAYGCVISEDKRSPISLLLSKSRVNPLKFVSIPRLELAAAVLAVKIYLLLKRAIGKNIGSVVFWTDSMIVLHYINNESTRFTTYVANRLAMIHCHTVPDQWHHVGTAENPADLTSRGAMDMKQKAFWLNGPEFLQHFRENWPKVALCDNQVDGIELKRVSCNTLTSAWENKLASLLQRFSDWGKLLRSVAWLMRFQLYIKVMFGQCVNSSLSIGPLRVAELRESEFSIIRLVQKEGFRCETNSATIGMTPNSLRKLRPYLVAGILYVGGRLQHSQLNNASKHPVILPKGHHVTNLIINHFHLLEGHAGPTHILSILRRKYWIVNGLASVKRVLSKCMKCKRLNARTSSQLMSSLPSVRVTCNDYPFAKVGLDYFGPFNVKRGRSLEKRYGCLFTCLQSRAVHIEVAHSMSTDSFMMVLLRFISRRGAPEDIYSDNGSNFVGADKALQVWVKDIDSSIVSKKLATRGIQWHFNPPYASHRGGVWERLIRTVRRALSGMCLEQNPSDETLLTALTEAERIVNNRPLIPLSSDDVDALSLCPNDLLLRRSNWKKPSSIGFVERMRMNWKQSLYLAEVFWKRWRREYLPLLQERQRWINLRRNFVIGDVVLVVCDDQPKESWLLGVVETPNSSSDGMVRKVVVRTKHGLMERDIRKLCLLEGAQEDAVGWMGRDQLTNTSS